MPFDIIRKTNIRNLGGPNLYTLLRSNNTFIDNYRNKFIEIGEKKIINEDYAEFLTLLDLGSFIHDGKFFYTAGSLSVNKNNSNFANSACIREVSSSVYGQQVLFQKNPNALKTLLLPLTASRDLNALPFPFKFLREYDKLYLQRLAATTPKTNDSHTNHPTAQDTRDQD